MGGWFLVVPTMPASQNPLPDFNLNINNNLLVLFTKHSKYHLVALILGFNTWVCFLKNWWSGTIHTSLFLASSLSTLSFTLCLNFAIYSLFLKHTLQLYGVNIYQLMAVWKEKAWFVMFAKFCVNITTMSGFQLPMNYHWTQSWEELLTVACVSWYE